MVNWLDCARAMMFVTNLMCHRLNWNCRGYCGYENRTYARPNDVYAIELIRAREIERDRNNQIIGIASFGFYHSLNIPQRTGWIRAGSNAWQMDGAKTLEPKQLNAVGRVKWNVASNVRAAKQIGAHA